MTRGSRTRCTCRSPGIGSREERSTRRSRSSELRFPHAFPKTCGNSTGDSLDLAETCGILVYGPAGYRVLGFTTPDVYQRPELIEEQVRGALVASKVDRSPRRLDRPRCASP